MEIDPGYVQTEVGIMPQDWIVKPLWKLFIFSGGLSASRAQLGDIGYCYLHYGDIHTSSKSFIDLDTQKADLPKINIRLEDVPTKFLLFDGDVVFVDASEDDVGTSRHQVVRNPNGIPFISGLHTIVAKSKGSDLLNNYKCYCFQTRSIMKQFLFYCVGTKVSGISKTNIKKILLPIPLVLEQEIIAEILSDTDDLIESLEQLIIKKHQIKQGTMQEMLTGKRRLPGFCDKWEEKKLEDILDFERPDKYIVKSIEYSDMDEIPVLTANKSFILGYTDEKDGIYNNYPVIIYDDFTTDKKYVDFPFKVKSSAIKILKPKNNKDNLQFIFGKMQLIIFSISDHKRYYISEYQHLQILMPKEKEQTAIAEILSEMDSEIASLEDKLTKTRLVKQGMMQELLSGRIRLL